MSEFLSENVLSSGGDELIQHEFFLPLSQAGEGPRDVDSRPRAMLLVITYKSQGAS